MKKSIISLVFLLFFTVAGYGQNIDKFISELAKEKEAENFKMGGFLFLLAKSFVKFDMDSDEDRILCNGIKSIQTIDIHNCDEQKSNVYLSKLNQIKDMDGYETIIKTKDKIENVRIILNSNNNYIKKLYIVSIDKNNISAVKLTGKLKKKDLEKLTTKYNK